MDADIDGDQERKAHWTQALSVSEGEIFDLTKPDVFAMESRGNVDDRVDEDFERLIFLLEGKGVTNPTSKTTYEFYKRLEFIHEEIKLSNRPKHQGG